jgi:hypothetical protein
MASRNGTTAVEAQIVHDFDALLAEVRSNDGPPILFNMGAERFTIPNPLDWSDDVLRLQSVVAAEGPEGQAAVPGAVVALAEALLGDQYAKFEECGGSALHLSRVLPRMLGTPVGESSAS